MSIAIVTTTIFPIQPFLSAYVDNIQKWGYKNEVAIYIAGDNKSSADSLDAASQFKQMGFQVRFLDIKWQRDYLSRFADLKAIIPENSDNRRNVAYLAALEDGAQTIISVDDDNFPDPEQDFIGQHLCVGKSVDLPEAIGMDGWYNLCSLLIPTRPDANLYPRGFPYWSRKDGTDFIGDISSGKIAVNVGLWTLDPDTDAIGRLYARPHISKWNGNEVILGQGIRTPINTQNTALSRDAMITYYYVCMGDLLRGMRLDRFGDIFSGYFLQLCADAVGNRIRIGSPVVEHRRNQHNLLLDLYNELAGIMIIEDLTSFLMNVELPTNSMYDAYKSLSIKLEEFSVQQEGFIWDSDTKKFFHKVAKNMRIWADVVKGLG